jgi:hypothetical protein
VDDRPDRRISSGRTRAGRRNGPRPSLARRRPASQRWPVVTALPAGLGPHVPHRPLWICRVCAGSWPCAIARLKLKAEYSDDRAALCVYLCGLMHEAAADLYRLNPHDAPAPQAIFDRFTGWAPPRTLW